MKVFMLGWEFPPFISGGLGTACYGLTKGLDEVGVEVCFVLPTAIPLEQGASGASHVQLRTPADVKASKEVKLSPELQAKREALAHEFAHLKIHRLAANLQAYASPENFEVELQKMRKQARDEATKDILRDTLNHISEKNLPPPVAKTSKAAKKNKTQASFPKGSFVVGGAGVHYDGDLISQIHRYACLAVELACDEEFDVIHAHDWMTYPAGQAAAAATGKPLVVHVHSTEFDRSGENVNQQVYDIERTGMHTAARVICVSHLTKNIVMHRYGVADDKIQVVYNAVDLPNDVLQMKPIGRNEKIVLFLGRVTMQKGPEYFLQAAKKVIEKFKNVRFIVAGSGDMIRSCIQLAADLKLGRYVTFTGFLRGGDVERVFEMADLYVMPSVSEPFGIAPLEALSHNVPVIISKQSGVSEVLTHVLKVDFWDTDEMANKILAVLRHEPLQKTLRQQSQFELQKFSWQDSARIIKQVYEDVTA